MEHAGHGVPGNGAGRRLVVDVGDQAGALGLPHADHQHPARPEVDGRRQGRELAHGAVTKVFLVAVHPQGHRREQERNGAGGHQVLDGDGLEVGAPPGAVPGLHRVVGPGLAEGPVFARGVARRGDPQHIDVALLQRALQTIEVDRAVQAVHQGQGVEQGAVAPHLARQREPGDDAVGAHPARRFEPVDVLRTQAAPERGQAGQGVQPIGGVAGEVGRVERAGRGAEQPLEGEGGRRRIGAGGGPARQHGRHRLEHAGLVGRAGAAAHQYQRAIARGGFGQLGVQQIA